MIPIQNTIQDVDKYIKLSCVEAHYIREGKVYSIIQHLFDPPLQIDVGDTAIISWKIVVM